MLSVQTLLGEADRRSDYLLMFSGVQKDREAVGEEGVSPRESYTISNYSTHLETGRKGIISISTSQPHAFSTHTDMYKHPHKHTLTRTCPHTDMSARRTSSNISSQYRSFNPQQF